MSTVVLTEIKQRKMTQEAFEKLKKEYGRVPEVREVAIYLNVERGPDPNFNFAKTYRFLSQIMKRQR